MYSKNVSNLYFKLSILISIQVLYTFILYILYTMWDVCMQFMVLYWNGFMLIDDLGFVFCGTYNDALVLGWYKWSFIKWIDRNLIYKIHIEMLGAISYIILKVICANISRRITHFAVKAIYIYASIKFVYRLRTVNVNTNDKKVEFCVGCLTVISI